LGIDTFVATSARVFPTDMKAAPLLRAWLSRLRDAGVDLHTRPRWLGWDDRGRLELARPPGSRHPQAAAPALALGGGSGSRPGSDGSWVDILRRQGVTVSELLPANCGFLVSWSEHLRQRFAGAPLKPVTATVTTTRGECLQRRGEAILSE